MEIGLFSGIETRHGCRNGVEPRVQSRKYGVPRLPSCRVGEYIGSSLELYLRSRHRQVRRIKDGYVDARWPDWIVAPGSLEVD
jgi:hypothetical protein